MTDGQISACSVRFCSKKRDICMNNKEGSRLQHSISYSYSQSDHLGDLDVEGISILK
jgi:hypothetical protein